MTKKKAATKTKRAVLDALKLGGPSDASTLAEQQGLSAMAVRQHLYALQEEGFVTFSEVPRPVGRPVKQWALTPSADRFFPDAHADLTAGLLGAMRSVFGEDGLKRLIAERTAQQIASYAERTDPLKSLQEKLNELAAIRSEEGYMAGIEANGSGFLFIENHCPICVAASACSGLCDGELTVFQAVLGPKVKVARTDHALTGANRCAYTVIPIS